MFPNCIASLRAGRAARRTVPGRGYSRGCGARPPASLSLDDAVHRAVTQAPALAAQQAAIRAAGSEAIRAPALPDPQLIIAVDSLHLGGDERFSLTRDWMTTRKLGVMQEFPREEKRRLRGERAQARTVPEVARVFGKVGRADTPSAKAPCSAYARRR